MSEVKTIFVTGSSAGIGRSIVKYFHARGWNVAATMRTPSQEIELNRLPGVICPKLDVTSGESIEAAIKAAIDTFGKIDVLVNNAGYGLSGPFEGATEDQIRKQFDTNVFGLMKCTRSILSYFRSQKSGIIINISSMGGRLAFPYYSLYHSTKWAVEGFTESLRYEVEPLGIRVKLIEPGVIKTEFLGRSSDSSFDSAPPEYHQLAKLALQNINKAGDNGSTSEEVAAEVFKAATDQSLKLRYSVGSNSGILLFLRRLLSDQVFAKIVRLQVFKK
jgi:NAD(P)-dependent dehydrogenase (short-subunit alcohol dehydrogenase family)